MPPLIHSLLASDNLLFALLASPSAKQTLGQGFGDAAAISLLRRCLVNQNSMPPSSTSALDSANVPSPHQMIFTASNLNDLVLELVVFTE